MVDARASRFKVPRSRFRVRASRILSIEGSTTRAKKDPSLRSGQALNLELFLFIARLSLFDMHKAEVLHQRPVVMDQEARRTIAGVEMLMPAKNGNTENVSFAPVVAPIFDETVTLSGDDVVHLFVHMPMGPRALAGGNLGEQRSQHPHEKSGLWVDHIAHSAHRRLLELDFRIIN